MKDIIKKICNLFSAGTLISFTVIGTFCYLAIKGSIPSEKISEAALIILTFFFAKQTATKAAEETKDEELKK